MSKRDYYDVLGLNRSASEEDIKRAYRKLARQFHPDVNKSPDAQRRFTEIQEAYDTLSDPGKRRMYDQFGHDAQRAGRAGAQPRSGPWPGGHAGGAPFEGEDLGSVFEAIFGGRAGARRQAPSPFDQDAEPEPLRHEITIPFERALGGGAESIRLEESAPGRRGSKGRTIEIKIPPGIADGSQLRIPGAGSAQRGAPDLIVTVRVRAHPLFRRGEFEETGRGLDLYLDLPISIAEATLGATVRIPTLDGTAEVMIPAGTASGRKLRLRGQGMQDAATRGDLYALVRIVPPAGGELTPDERRILEQVSSRTPTIRAGAGWPKPR